MGYKEEALDFLGVTKWHKLGYTGSGIKIMSDERVCNKAHPDVISPNGFKSDWTHGDDVMVHIKIIAPDATFIAYPFSGSFHSDTYNCKCAEYIIENNVLIFTTSSLSSSINAGKEKAMQDCIDSGCIFFTAAGNQGTQGIHGEAKSEKYLAIGGIKPYYNSKTRKYEWDKLSKTNYSSVGKELDYVTIAEISNAVGTSFCSPVFASMCGLVQQFFILKANRPLTRAEMILFISDNLIDVDASGFDKNTGRGIFILPDPDTIDIKKYCKDYNADVITNEDTKEIINQNKKTIKLYIGNKNITVNDKQIISDVAPFIKDGRTMVPLRIISEIFGYNVLWDGNTQEVKIISE